MPKQQGWRNRTRPILAGLLKGEIGSKAASLQKEMEFYIGGLDALMRDTLASLQAQFDRLGDLAAAFNTGLNHQFVEARIVLAKEYDKIFKTHAGLEKYLSD